MSFVGQLILAAAQGLVLIGRPSAPRHAYHTLAPSSARHTAAPPHLCRTAGVPRRVRCRSTRMDSDNDQEEKLRRFLEGMIVVDASGPEDDDEDDEPSGGSGSGGSADGLAAAEAALRELRNFDLKPKEVRDFLDQYVIHQSEAKKVLSVAVCDHYNHVRRCLNEPSTRRMDYSKPNILLLGPTGVGKTYLMRMISRLIHVPFVKADATKFSETGVVGKDVEDLVRELIDAAGGNHTLAQYGIIYVDEVDKITNGASGGGTAMRGGWNTRGVQNNFLKLLEETEVSTQSQMAAAMVGGPFGGPSKPKTINTRHMLFVFSGAFHDLDKQIMARRDTKTLGFAVEDDTDGRDGDDDDDERGEHDGPRSALRHAETKDFIDAGLEPEFIGRIPVRVACDPLGEGELRRILVESKGSVLRQFEDDLGGYNISLSCDDDALTQLARLAAAEKTGARGLLTVLERTLRDFKFELPSSTISSLRVDNATVCEPARALQALLDGQTQLEKAELMLADLKRFEAGFAREHAPLHVWFTDEAIDIMCAAALTQQTSAFSLARARFEHLADALQKVSSLSGQQSFPISAALAREPEATLREWVDSVEKARAD